MVEQGYSVASTAALLGITDKLPYNWTGKYEAEQSGQALTIDKRAELIQLQREQSTADGKDILKKASALLLKENK